MARDDSDFDSGVIGEINLTPLVDVIFTILIVFIVSIPLLTNVIPVSLPRTAPTAEAQKVSDVRVSIDAAGQVFLDQTRIAADALEGELRRRNAEGNLRVEILADEAVAYREVARAMAQIRRAGITRFTFVILPEAGRAPG